MQGIKDLIGPKATEYLGLFVYTLLLPFLIYLVPHTLSLSLSETELHSKGLDIPRILMKITVPNVVFTALFISALNISHQIKDLRLMESNDHV